MPKHPHLARRNNVYYLRRRVPTDLLQHYAPKVQFMLSLGTSDYREAQRRVRLETAKLDEQFDRIRAYQAAPVQEELSDADIKRLTALYIHNLLDEDDEVRRDGLWFRDGLGPLDGINERDFAELGDTLEEMLLAMRHAAARGDISLITSELDMLLEDEGIKLPPGSEAYRKVALAVLRANVQALEIKRQRQSGEPIETPPAPPRLTVWPTAALASPQEDGITVQELWERYRKERKAVAKTEADFGTSIRRFIEVNGNLPVNSVTKAHARAFKDAMLQIPARLGGKNRSLTVPELLKRFGDSDLPRLTPQTVNEKALAGVRAVFGYAVSNGFRDDNPISGIRATGEASQEISRLPYSPEELKTIFASPVFTEGKLYEGGGGVAAKWLPLLSLFSGARLEELGRLEAADIGEEQGVPYFFIRAGEGTRRIKNRVSRRKVPVHSELIRLGFLEYVESRRKAGGKTLFPDLKSGLAQRTAAFSKWWGRYLDGLGITSKAKVFHSFRHGVERGLRDAGVHFVLIDAIVGHAPKDVAGSYGLDEEGQGYSLPVLRDALERLVYPGIEAMFNTIKKL